MSRNHRRLRGWERFRRRLLDVRGWRCERCAGAGKLELHHKIPLEHGGQAFGKSNVEVLCRSCHIEHHRPDAGPGVAAWKKLLDEIMIGF